MPTYHIPKGVSRDALEAVVAGWDAAGAATEPKHTTDVEAVTDITGAVERQTQFLDSVGVLEAAGEKHRLTERGRALADALAAGDDDRARERARELLVEWPVTESVRGIVRGNPTDEDELVRIVAAATGHDPDASRVRSGAATLLDLYDWAGLLERDDGRYRLPGAERARATGDAESAAEARCGISLAGGAEESEEASVPTEAAERADGAAAEREPGK